MSARVLIVLRLMFALALLPLAAGIVIVTYQDAAMTHLPGKWATVEAVRAGSFPFLQPYASFGQPLAGNPNFGTFFPDTLLFLLLPLTVAFGAHFAIAAALGFLGARRWARAEGADSGAADVAAFAFILRRGSWPRPHGWRGEERRSARAPSSACGARSRSSPASPSSRC